MRIFSSLIELKSYINYGYAIYSPSLDKVWNHRQNRLNEIVAAPDTNRVDLFSIAKSYIKAFEDISIFNHNAGVSDGTVVKVQSFTEKSNSRSEPLTQMVTGEWDLDTFALWLISNGYAQIVLPKAE